MAMRSAMQRAGAGALSRLLSMDAGHPAQLDCTESEQEAIGAWLLAEMESERRWDDLFAKTGSALDRMADHALKDHERGLPTPLDPDRL